MANLQELVSHAEGFRDELQSTQADLVRAQSTASNAIFFGMCAMDVILGLAVVWRGW